MREKIYTSEHQYRAVRHARMHDELTRDTELAKAQGVSIRFVAPQKLNKRARQEPDRFIVDLRGVLLQAIDSLDERLRMIVRRSWGIDGDPATFKEIAKSLNLTRGRVEQLENEAIRILFKRICVIAGIGDILTDRTAREKILQ